MTRDEILEAAETLRREMGCGCGGCCKDARRMEEIQATASPEEIDEIVAIMEASS